jgi:hypothetical protein
MSESKYTGRFSIAAVDRILAAAAPLPDDLLEIDDREGGVRRPCSRGEVIIRRLEWVAVWTQMSVQHQSDLSPSDLAKRFNAINSAATALIEALGVNTDLEPRSMQRQVFNGLRWVAERHGERIGGFFNHPPHDWSPKGADLVVRDYQGDSQLQDDIAGVGRLRDWARECRQSARAMVGRPDVERQVGVELGLEPWLGDPVNDAIGMILRIWTDVVGRPLTTKVDAAGVAGGELIAFVTECLNALGLQQGRDGALGSDALRARIRRAVQTNKSRFQES